MNIVILAFDGLFDTGLAALQDTFAIADEIGENASRVTCVGVRRNVMTAHGLRVPLTSIIDLPQPDVVIVPALGARTPATLPTALGCPDIKAGTRLLRDWQKGGALITAACTGAFVLAEAGLLDGRTATTSWWLGPFFRSCYPQVRLDDSHMIVQSDGIVTAGAAIAHFDLALWLIRRVSPDLAARTARYLMIDPRSSQAAYIIPDHLSHADPIVERFEHWVRENIGVSFSLDLAATAAGTSARTLSRRVNAVLGKSPLGYVQDVRIATARQLLATSNLSVDRIAEEVGYDNAATLRTLLKTRTGRTASAYRAMCPGPVGHPC